LRTSLSEEAIEKGFAAVHESACGPSLPIPHVRFDGEFRGESGLSRLDLLDHFVVLNSVIEINERGCSLRLNDRPTDITFGELANVIYRRPPCQLQVLDSLVNVSLTNRG
jgi:hypothetical protein